MNRIRLHQYPAVWQPPSLSPFCIKVETYLKLARFPYEVIVATNPLKGPRGRMPFIEDGDAIVSDSRLIIDHLERKSESPLDSKLTPEQRSVSLAFHRLLDQDLIRVVLYSRWVDPEGWKVLREAFRGFFPLGLRSFSLRAIRHSLLSEARGSGITELTREEIYALGDAHLRAISAYLGEKPYFFGDAPTTVDANLYGFLSVILDTPIPVPPRRTLLGDSRLVSFCDRMGGRFRG